MVCFYVNLYLLYSFRHHFCGYRYDYLNRNFLPTRNKTIIINHLVALSSLLIYNQVFTNNLFETNYL